MQIASTPYQADSPLSFTVKYYDAGGTLRQSFTVPASECGLVGVYVDGKPYKPASQPIEALLPYNRRKAFGRALGWWQDKLACDVLHLRLASLDSRPLGQLVATIKHNLL